MSTMPIHANHPNSSPHPFKGLSLCGKMIRFGGLEIENTRPATCKKCLEVKKKICPCCGGTGVKANNG